MGCVLLRGVPHSCFHFHGEAVSTLCTLILDRHPVVPLVIRGLSQFSAAALKDTALQVESVRAIFWIRVDVVVVGHVGCLA